MSIPDTVAALLDGDRAHVRVAVIGASNATYKYGNIILRDLVQKNFEVVPINPGCEEVEGRRCYPTIEAAGFVDIANFVVPPRVAREVVAGLPPDAARVLWFQPGSFDAEVVDLARTRFATVVAGPCIMVEARRDASNAQL